MKHDSSSVNTEWFEWNLKTMWSNRHFFKGKWNGNLLIQKHSNSEEWKFWGGKVEWDTNLMNRNKNSNKWIVLAIEQKLLEPNYNEWNQEKIISHLGKKITERQNDAHGFLRYTFIRLLFSKLRSM